jgi:hypothetical protein
VTHGPEPRWLPVALAIYGTCLWLYPPAFRREFGASMKQALRDPFREVAAGRLSAWRLFAHDAVLDSVLAAGAAHVDVGLGPVRRRDVVQVSLLAGACALLALQDTIGPATIRAGQFVASQSRQAYFEFHRRRWEAAEREVAAALIASPAEDDRALGAWLLASNDRFQAWRWPKLAPELDHGPIADDAARVREVAASLAGSRSAFALATAATACGPQVACDNTALLLRLEAVDPGNGFASFELFESANRARDDRARTAVLSRAAAASGYEGYRIAMRQRALRAAIALHPGDDAFLVRFAHHVLRSGWLRHDDARNGVATYCRPRYVNPSTGTAMRRDDDPRFTDGPPQERDACLAIARVLSRAGDPRVRNEGGSLLLDLGAPDAPSAEALRAQSRLAYRHEAPEGRPRGSDYGSDAWLAWAKQQAATGATPGS